jgi:HKD family nuclease
MQLNLLTHDNPLGPEISNSLKSGDYENFRMVVAYAKKSGIGRLHDDLKYFKENGGKTEAVIGIDQSITSYQALLNLSTFAESNLYIHYDKGSISFHPKIYLFGNDTIEKAIIGSSNLTAGGLYLNFEANVAVNFDSSADSNNLKSQITLYWQNLISDSNTKSANLSFLNHLLELGTLYDENKQKSFDHIISKVSKMPFNSRNRPSIPNLSTEISTTIPTLKDNFAMLLSGFDVSSRSQDPIVLIPIKALQQYPTFWNWPKFYTQSGSGYPQHYANANVTVDSNVFSNQVVRIYYYDSKDEFRFQCEPIKRNGNRGDMILISKEDIRPFNFNIELIRKNSSKYNSLISRLTIKVSPQKRYNYF